MNKFSSEVRERAVRMVHEHRGEYPSLWAAIESIAPKIGCVPQTLNEWVKRDGVDNGQREGLTTSEREPLKALRREVKELGRTNDIHQDGQRVFRPGGARPPVEELKAYLDRHRDTLGGEPICRVLQIAPSCYRRHAARLRNPALRCARAQHDCELIPHIQRVWQTNMQVYGADKVWKQMNREGIAVARCMVERLMRHLGLRGVRRGKVIRTPVGDANALCPLDRVNRQFKADRPNQLWVSDFTYVSTWQGWQYVAFVIDVYARRIVGWRQSSSMRTDFVLDETINGLYKAELIHRRAFWKTKESLALATLEWVSWFNHHRLLEPIGYIPPAEAEENYYWQLVRQTATAG